MPAPWESQNPDRLYFYSRLKVRQWLDGEIKVLIVAGHLGEEGASEEFTSLLRQAGEEPFRGVILDLRNVSFLPSKVLPALVALRTELTQRGGMPAIVAPTERLNRLLGLVGMEKAVLITSDPEAAYDAVRKCLDSGAS